MCTFTFLVIPSYCWAVAFDIHCDFCAGSAHRTEHSVIFVDSVLLSVLHECHCFFFCFQ